MGYKTTDELMLHLCENGIEIKGEDQKRLLINTGYYHGYKGYRFFKKPHNKIPFKTYDEIYATIQYDSKLKTLIYEKMMFIETAIKNIALESILIYADSESINDMFDKVICGYNNVPKTISPKNRKNIQQNKLNLKNTIQSNLARAYKNNNPKITHFYNGIGYSDVPIWALFEIMTMGDMGRLLSCLTFEVRDNISKRIGFNVSCDTNRELIYKYLYTLKDLRNAIAHNSVIFDGRFKKISITKPMRRCLEIEIGLSYVNFDTIGDYIILICYYLKLLKVSKDEIDCFISDFKEIVNDYKSLVPLEIYAKVVHVDLDSRLSILKKFI